MNIHRPAQLMAVITAAAFIFSGSVLAETKIGFVDTAKLMEAAPQVKAAQALAQDAGVKATGDASK